MPPPTALLDANALYPAGLRHLLLRLADRHLHTPLWSAVIHEEWMRSLLDDRPDIEAGVLERTRAVMDGYFPDALVTGYEALAANLDLPDPGDRHVLAAAVVGGADIIVTRNLRDFPAERLAPHGPVALHPDDFVAKLFEAEADAVLDIVRGHRAALRRPPRSIGAYLAAPERLCLSRTISLLRRHDTAI